MVDRKLADKKGLSLRAEEMSHFAFNLLYWSEAISEPVFVFVQTSNTTAKVFLICFRVFSRISWA
ncbi:hypothetical protein A2V82_09965 [candidate division KSB1 bacterium RBG_16_48_16]|nr:MAG: hypothetical protein A2V82_09965 [candidate division KSB1 bacterium RBG_16_48_16]